MIEDITELVRAQRHAVWSEVARRMAHEIKNPLTPIQLSAERIAKNLERYGDSLPDAHYKQVLSECTTTIVSEVHTLQRMVNEFTRFARLPQATLEEAPLNQVVEATMKLYEDRLNGLTIESRLAEDLPPVKLDAEQIKRALVNLIDNAIEAVQVVEGEQRITVETQYLRESETARIVVSDTGAGIDPKDHPRLFTPYFSRRQSGTGLGLAIVSRIVAEHQGRVRAENNTPRGARFIIDLPVCHNQF
jgi:nitrogen fixation/metabolism regulation signal transduction histidine kinase